MDVKLKKRSIKMCISIYLLFCTILMVFLSCQPYAGLEMLVPAVVFLIAGISMWAIPRTNGFLRAVPWVLMYAVSIFTIFLTILIPRPPFWIWVFPALNFIVVCLMYELSRSDSVQTDCLTWVVGLIWIIIFLVALVVSVKTDTSFYPVYRHRSVICYYQAALFMLFSISLYLTRRHGLLFVLIKGLLLTVSSCLLFVYFDGILSLVLSVTILINMFLTIITKGQPLCSDDNTQVIDYE